MKFLIDDFNHRCPKTGLVFMDERDYTLGTGSDSSSVELTNYIGGSHVSIRETSKKGTLHQPKRKRDWVRGTCKGFSKRSRQNMERGLNKVNRKKLTCPELFITLTYGKNLPEDFKKVKSHLHKFVLWLVYNYPSVCGTWRLENQEKRSRREGKISYHYHLLVYNLEYLPHDKLSKYWTKMTGGDEEHLQSGVRVERSKSPKEVHNYLIKYISKTDYSFGDGEHGRIWGRFNRKEYDKLIDENVVEIKEQVNTDTGEITTPDEFCERMKKLIMKYKDSYSRKKWGKKYNKDYHYSIRKFVDEKVINVDFKQKKSKGYMVLDVHHHLKPDRMTILWDDNTLDKVIDYITGEVPKNNITSVLRDWNERNL